MTNPSLHDDFIGRVNYAEQCFLTHATNSRPFDDCFEQYDGSAVVTALVRRAQTNPTLYAAIAKDWRDGFPTSWIETETQYANWPTSDLARLAHALRTTQEQGIAQQQLPELDTRQTTDTDPSRSTHAVSIIDTPSTAIATTDHTPPTEEHLMDQPPVPLLQPFETAQFCQPEYDQSLTTFDVDPPRSGPISRPVDLDRPDRADSIRVCRGLATASAMICVNESSTND